MQNLQPHFFETLECQIFHRSPSPLTTNPFPKKLKIKKNPKGTFKIVIIISDAILAYMGTRPSKILNLFFNKNPFDVYAFRQYLPLG